MNYEKKFLSTKEAAEYLGTTISGINNLCGKKKIRYYKPDNRKFFAVSDIEAFIMSGIVVEPVKSIE